MENEEKPLQIIVGDDPTADHPDLPARGVVIDPDDTRYFAASACDADAWHRDVPSYIEMFGDLFPRWPMTYDEMSLAQRHVSGLLTASLEFAERNTRFTWRLPETYLHPRHQLTLADVAIKLLDLTGNPRT